jgi:hypothetical protein
MVQGKVRVVAPVISKTVVMKEVLPEPGPSNQLEELLGDDLIRINVGPVKSRHYCFKGGEFLH